MSIEDTERRPRASRSRARAGGQIGRSLPRLEGREKVTGRAEYTHKMRLPGMLHGKIFRSTVAHGRIKSIDTSAARKMPGVHRVVHRRRHPQGDPRSLLRPGVPRPADPGDRQGALRRRAGRGGARRRSACRRGGGAADRRRIRGTAGGVRRGRGDDLDDLRARRAQARRHLRRSQAPQGRDAAPTSRSTSKLRRGDVDKAFADAPRTCSSTPSAPRRCCTCRSSRLSRSPTARESQRHDPHRLAGPVVRAHRDRAAARLAARTGCASRCRISAAASAPSSTSSSRRW